MPRLTRPLVPLLPRTRWVLAVESRRLRMSVMCVASTAAEIAAILFVSVLFFVFSCCLPLPFVSLLTAVTPSPTPIPWSSLPCIPSYAVLVILFVFSMWPPAEFVITFGEKYARVLDTHTAVRFDAACLVWRNCPCCL